MSMRLVILLLSLALGSAADEVPKVTVDPYPLAGADGFPHLSLVLENPQPRFAGRLRVVGDGDEILYEQALEVGKGTFRFHLYPTLAGLYPGSELALKLLPLEGEVLIRERELPVLMGLGSPDWQVLSVGAEHTLSDQHLARFQMNEVARTLALGPSGRERLEGGFRYPELHGTYPEELTRSSLEEARRLEETAPVEALQLLWELNWRAALDQQEEVDQLALSLLARVPLPEEPYVPIVTEGKVARMRAETLPDRWYGYATVGTIVWDVSAPARLESAQRRALEEWVRQGGNLIFWQNPEVALRHLPIQATLPPHPETGWQQVPWGFGMLTLATLSEAEWLELERKELLVLLGAPPDASPGEYVSPSFRYSFEHYLDELIGFVRFDMGAMWRLGLLFVLTVSVLDWCWLRWLRKWHWSWVSWPLLILLGCGMSYLAFYQRATLPQEARLSISDLLPGEEMVRRMEVVGLRHRSLEPIELVLGERELLQAGVDLDAYERPFVCQTSGETRKVSLQQEVGLLSQLVRRPVLGQEKLRTRTFPATRLDGTTVELTCRAPAGWEEVTPLVCWPGIDWSDRTEDRLTASTVLASVSYPDLPTLRPDPSWDKQVLVLLIREGGEAQMEVVRQLVDVPP